MDIKAQIVEEVSAQLAEFKLALRQEVIALVKAELSTSVAKINTKITNVCESIKKDNTQLISTQNSMQLTTNSKVSKEIERNILSVVNKTYGEKIAKMSEYAAYQFQDTDEMLNEYRHEVIRNDNRSNRKLLTRDNNTRHILSEQVSLAFDYDRDD